MRGLRGKEMSSMRGLRKTRGITSTRGQGIRDKIDKGVKGTRR